MESAKQKGREMFEHLSAFLYMIWFYFSLQSSQATFAPSAALLYTR